MSALLVVLIVVAVIVIAGGVIAAVVITRNSTPDTQTDTPTDTDTQTDTDGEPDTNGEPTPANGGDAGDPECACWDTKFPHYGHGNKETKFFCWKNSSNFGTRPRLGTNARSVCR